MIYVYNESTRKVVKAYRTEEEFQHSKYADWSDGDWADAGLALCLEASAAWGCVDGLIA